MTQRDVVLRWIEQIAAVVRRMVFGPGPADLEAARRHVTEATALHLGHLAAVIPRLEVQTAVELLRDSNRILGLALLLDLEASIEQAAGNPGAAEELRARAAEFRRAIGEVASDATTG